MSRPYTALAALLVLVVLAGAAGVQAQHGPRHAFPPEARAHLLDFLRALFPELAPHAAPVVSYASPTGSGSACTEPAPCTIQTWLTSPLVVPGATLVLSPGTYTGSAQMLQIPDTFAGTQGAPITIQAAQDGTVLLDGQDSRRPIHTRGKYGILRGVNVRKGDNQNVYISGQFWRLERIVSWDVGVGGDANIHMSGSDNLIEDCAAFGPARKPIAIGAAGGERNTIRRCVTRWAANDHQTSNPSVSLEVGYGQNTATVENSVMTWNTQGRVTEPEGLGELFSTRGSKWLGSIFLVEKSDTYSPYVLMRAYTDAGSHAQSGDFNPTSGLVFTHNVAYIDPAHAKFREVRGWYFAESTTSGAPAGTGNTLSHLVSVSGLAPQFSSRSFPASQVQHGATLAAAIGTGKSLWTDSVAAPGLCKRYVGGVLTEDPLWPWPMDARIVDAMAQAGVEPVHVTQTMEQLFGPIPPACRAGSAPGPCVPTCPASVPCGTSVADSCGTAHACPGPVCPPMPPGTASLSCNGDLLSSGKISLTCLPQTRR